MNKLFTSFNLSLLALLVFVPLLLGAVGMVFWGFIQAMFIGTVITVSAVVTDGWVIIFKMVAVLMISVMFGRYYRNFFQSFLLKLEPLYAPIDDAARLILLFGKSLTIISLFQGGWLSGFPFSRKIRLRLAAWAVLFTSVAQVAQAQTYTLGSGLAINNATITTCSGTFYDSGGAGGNYGNNENTTVTFTASTPGLPMVILFTGTTGYGTGDALRLYNGTTTAAPEFANSPMLFPTSNGVFVAPGGSITVQFISNAISVGAGWSATILCASETTTTACTGSFLDPGGAGNYAISTSSMTHICSNNGGQARTTFSSFALENGFDYLYIFDGATLSASQVAGSPFTGAVSPGTVTGTGTCLTFLFISDPSGVAAGWSSTISCVPACAISSVTAVTACAGATYNLSGAVTFSDPPTVGTLTVTDGVTTQTFTAPFTSPTNYSLTGFSPGSGMHTVTAVFSSYNTCTANTTYTAPVTCACPNPNCGTVTLVKNP